MADIAQLGFSADTSDLTTAKASLEALVPAASKVEKAANKVDQALTGIGGGASSAASGLNKVNSAANNAANGVNNAGNAANSATGGINNVGNAAVGAGGKLQQLDAHVIAFRNRLATIPAAAGAAGNAINAMNNRIVASGGAMKANVGNIAAQFQDIGVTAGMGMNPLMIALQQGTQLSAVFAQSGVSAGQAIKGAFAQIFSSSALLTIGIIGLVAAGLQMINWTEVARAALYGLANVIEAVAPYAVAAAGALALIYAPAIIRGIWGLTSGFVGLLASMVACLGIPVMVVAGLTAIVAAAVIWRDELTQMLGFDIVNAAKWGVNYIIGAFVGAFRLIKLTWQHFPEVMELIFNSVLNMGIDAANGIASAFVAAFNWIARAWRSSGVLNAMESSVRQARDLETDPGRRAQMSAVLGGLERNRAQREAPVLGMTPIPRRQVSAGAAAVREEGQGAVRDAMRTDYVGEAVGAITRGGRALAGALRGAAAGLGAAAPGRNRRGAGGGGGRTDAEKFQDITEGAERDIATVQAQINGINQTAEAALRLRNEQDLLNKANQQGITLSVDQRARLMELAGALTEVQMRLRDAQGMQEILQGADRRIANLQAEGRMIGLVGEQLLREQRYQELLNEATQKGVRLTAEYIAQLRQRANELARAETANVHDQFMSDFGRDAEERMRELLQERSYIGMAAGDVARLRIEYELLADARRRNIVLTPEEIQRIRDVARAQAEVAEATRRLREQMDFAKDITKGFVKDMLTGLQQGKSVWETFGNAVINVLNKIIDRLLDKMIEKLINSLFSAMGSGPGGGPGGGGIGSSIGNIITSLFAAKGYAFGQSGVAAFADGGTFTNSVVSRPTMFAYGGGNLGIMGEAGEEAILPLQRGPDGSLGVQMYGAHNGSKAPIINIPVTVNNDNRAQGALSSQDIVDMQKRASDNTKKEIKREIPALLTQLQRDGTL